MKKPLHSSPIELKLLPSLPSSETCFSCRGCCIFHDADSAWLPYFNEDEIGHAIVAGVDEASFPNRHGGRIVSVPHDDAVRCPALDPVTHACTIYNVRPLDCQLYPFILMWNAERKIVLALHEACPFVFLQTNPLPEELTKRAADLTASLQTSQMIESLFYNPDMIMPTQPDTIPIVTLDRLSYALKSNASFPNGFVGNP